MPELPEVETVRRRLAPVLEGTTITAVDGSDLRSGNFGDVHATLVFDKMLDANGDAIGERASTASSE